MSCLSVKGCSSPIVVKFADTQKDKEQKRMAQQLQQQMQQLSAASMWGNLTGLNSLGPQYLAVSVCLKGLCVCSCKWFRISHVLGALTSTYLPFLPRL